MLGHLRNQVNCVTLTGIRQLCKAGWVNSRDDSLLSCVSRDNEAPRLAPVLGTVDKVHRQPAKSLSALLEFSWGPMVNPIGLFCSLFVPVPGMEPRTP